MDTPVASTKDCKRRTARPVAQAPRPARRIQTVRKPRNPASSPWQIVALVRAAQAEERAAGSAMQAYSVRQRLDRQISALADRIADRPQTSRDDQLTLALAGWYATGARHALIRAVLRAGGINPSAPCLRMGGARGTALPPSIVKTCNRRRRD
jgi:hypothetical protein